jgi:hypothetical protein
MAGCEQTDSQQAAMTTIAKNTLALLCALMTITPAQQSPV